MAHPWAQAPGSPSIDHIINLKRVGSPAISPDGQQVAYTVRETNWDENAYETEIWIGEAATGRSRQLTNAAKSSLQPAWSPDGQWLAFISDRDGKRQVYRIAVAGGEAQKLTAAARVVLGMDTSPPTGHEAANYWKFSPFVNGLACRRRVDPTLGTVLRPPLGGQSNPWIVLASSGCRTRSSTRSRRARSSSARPPS